METGTFLIAKERMRQMEKEGWSSEHDSEHTHDELAWAAVCYAAPSIVTAEKMTKFGQWDCNCRSVGECYCCYYHKTFSELKDPWPWEDEWDKRDKHNRVRRLVIAGALIAAEIDRLNGTEPTNNMENKS